MQCKNLTSIDMDAILSVEMVAQPFPWSAKKIQDSLARADAVCFGAEKQSILFGYILGGLVLDEGEIWNFAVLPDLRRQRIGSQLLITLLNYFKEHFVKKVFLEVRASNKTAISFYQKAGFKQIGARKNYYEKGTEREDAILMRLLF